MNLDKLLAHRIDPIEQRISDRDCMLYALGIGFGDNPNDPAQLQYVYEDGLKVFPTMAAVIAHPGIWMTAPGLDLDVIKLLHGEQSLEMHRPLRVDCSYVGAYSILGVTDKGANKGALVHFQKKLTERDSGALAATVVSVYFFRADGGCGSTDYQPPAAPQPPQDPDENVTASIKTLPQSALIYRLSGDRNPLHADPAIAEKAGFERPILHGLCGYGIAARSVLAACGETNADRLQVFNLRFSAPVLPGDTLETRVQRAGNEIHFETVAADRGVTVLKQGYARLG